MRAGRLMAMLRLLQARGQMTAHDLASELEVSERTVLRDVEALNEAGLRVVAIRGSQGGFERYLVALDDLVGRLGNPHVHFVGHVSDEELVAFYDVADLFLCASEHEGFCVPLVEAFYKLVPVLAYAATAVPATMDGAGVLYEDRDPAHVAALMDAVVSNCALQDRIVEGQLAAVNRLRSKDFAGTLLGFVERILAAPRAGIPHVTFDFWEQFDAAAALEELRLDRPSIYKALPAR